MDCMMSILLMSMGMLVLWQYTYSMLTCQHESKLTLQALNVATGLLDECVYNRKLPRVMMERIEPFTIHWDVEEDIILSKMPASVDMLIPYETRIRVTISFKTLSGAPRSQTFIGGFIVCKEQL